MRRKWLWLLGALVVLAAVLLALHLARPIEHVGGPTAGERVPLDSGDHAGLDALLQKYVDEQGLVAYRAWKDTPADVQALDDYLVRLGSIDLEAPTSREGRLAFWINAYNAVTIHGILRHYPVASIQDLVSYVPGKYNIWRDLKLFVDNREYPLEDMEHEILRKMGEPRIHFALVCASKGCPPLRRRAYTEADLDRQLSDNARRFFARPSNFVANAAERTVHLSQLLHWYGSDFAPTPNAQVRLLRPYFPAPDTLAWLENPDVLVEFDLVYDWQLNERPSGRIE